MRSAVAALAPALILAACGSAPRAPAMERTPSSVLTSWALPAADRGDAPRPEGCLHVFNHTAQSADVWVGGEFVGRVGPHSSAAFFVGRSAGPSTGVRAVGARGIWEAELAGPPWDVSWHLEKAR